MIFRRQSAFPEITLSTTDSLKIQDVGISTIDPGWNRTTMEQGNHLIVCQALCKLPSPTHSNLITAFKEIDLCSGNTIVFHLLNPVLRILSNTTCPCPNQNFHILLFCIKA